MWDEIGARNFTIHFCFKTDGNVITGTHALLSKWSPVTQFWIGFEGGNLVLRVETSSAGQIVLTHDIQDVIYNDFWNFVQFSISSGGTYQFGLNGVLKTATDTNNLQTSDLSQLTIGDPTNPFTSDIYMTDLAVLDKVDNTYWYLLAFKMTHTDKECFKSLGPRYMFDLPAGWARDPWGAIPNEGIDGGVGYLVKKEAGDDPYLLDPSSYWNKQSLHLPNNTFFTIDQDIDLNWNETVSFLFDGHQTTNNASNEFTNPNDLHWNFTFVDLAESQTNVENWRFRHAFMCNGSSTVMGFQTKDATGVQLGKRGIAEGDQDAHSIYDNFGIYR
jgi:hypothetical protein